MKKLTVSIGIPAYNEEANIINTLRSIEKQKGDLFVLQRIIVVSDGSSDKTESKVREFAKNHKAIEMISDKKRSGKVARLNQLYKLNRSDILITYDADIVLGTDNTIEEMVREFVEDSKTVMVAAHQIPIRPDTFTGKIIYAGYEFWDRTRLSVKDCDHIQNHYGAATALRGSFIKNVRFPSDITDDRGYLYIRAKQAGNFRYTKRAYIYYRPVETMKDFLQLGDRSFTKNQDALAKHFSSEVYDMYAIPTRLKLIGIAITLLKSPFYGSMAILLNIYTRLFPRHDKLYDTGMWEIAGSTKRAIQVKAQNKRRGLLHRRFR